MNKYDDILNELVYQIDDVVYDFYSHTNELIGKKQNQESLLKFRDKTISTINDMNVRSLEIISGLKSEDLVRERAEHLLNKNKEIVESAMNFIHASNDKSELVESVQKFAENVYGQAKEIKTKLDESGVVDRLFEGAQMGLHKVQKGVEDLNQNPQFVKGKEVVIEKSKEALVKGAKIIQEGTKFVNDKLEKTTPKTDTDNQEIFKEDNSELKSIFDEVVREEKSDNKL